MKSVDLFLHQHVHLKKMGKEKKEKRKSEGGEEVEEKDGKEAWTEKTKYLSPISKPLASRKLTKRLYKVIKKGACMWNVHNIWNLSSRDYVSRLIKC